MDLDFIDDGAGWRVRRAAELAAEQRRRQRRHWEDRFGAGALRLIRIVMIPVVLSAAIFLAVLLYAAAEVAFGDELKEWYTPTAPGQCVPAAKIADAFGSPAFADPHRLYNFLEISGQRPHLIESRIEAGGTQTSVVFWGVGRDMFGTPVPDIEHMRYYRGRENCEIRSRRWRY